MNGPAAVPCNGDRDVLRMGAWDLRPQEHAPSRGSCYAAAIEPAGIRDCAGKGRHDYQAV